MSVCDAFTASSFGWGFTVHILVNGPIRGTKLFPQTVVKTSQNSLFMFSSYEPKVLVAALITYQILYRGNPTTFHSKITHVTLTML